MSSRITPATNYVRSILEALPPPPDDLTRAFVETGADYYRDAVENLRERTESNLEDMRTFSSVSTPSGPSRISGSIAAMTTRRAKYGKNALTEEGETNLRDQPREEKSDDAES